MEGRFFEIDVSDPAAKDKMRSPPVMDKQQLDQLFASVPLDVKEALARQEEAAEA
jgi:hypothetical protein